MVNEILLSLLLSLPPDPEFFPGYEPIPNPTPEEQIIVPLENASPQPSGLIVKI